MTGVFIGRLAEIDRDGGRLVASDQQSFRAAPAAIPQHLAVAQRVRIWFEERGGEAWVLQIWRE